MAQPTYAELFGTGATFNSGASRIEIPLTGLSASGLNATEPTALEALASVTKISSAWLSANTDETVMAGCDTTQFAPVQRNGLNKTQFQYALSFYGNYTTPTFDPDEV
jgi:hypothetical protein